MSKFIVPVFLLMIFCNCKSIQLFGQSKNEVFAKEIKELKLFFKIPAISVIVKNGNETVYEDYLGFASVENSIVNDSLTTFPMASLTKIFSGVLVMKLVEEKKLSLDEPINKYILNKGISDSIKIKHVLSHTSQGCVGRHFYYSNRFGWLTSVIEKAARHSFEREMQEKIFLPLGLKNTYLLKDSSQIIQEQRKIAKPYLYDGEVKSGFIDYGYSASAGIASTVRDLAIISEALDGNILITADSRRKMFTPFQSDLPYGQGVFSQKFQGIDLIWGYGQYDCFSSLFLKVPAKNLTLIIAANNSLVSDPARLIYGDITYSLFAISFLKNYVLNLPDEPLIEDSNSLKTLERRITSANSEFYLRKLLSQSLAESFLAQYHSRNKETSVAILQKVFKLYPDYERYADLCLLHNLVFLKAVYFGRDKKDLGAFDGEIEEIGKKLLAVDIDNPYANFYLANYFSGKGAIDKALPYYERIIKAGNFSRNWYTTEAERWMKEQNK